MCVCVRACVRECVHVCVRACHIILPGLAAIITAVMGCSRVCVRAYLCTFL